MELKFEIEKIPSLRATKVSEAIQIAVGSSGAGLLRQDCVLPRKDIKQKTSHLHAFAAIFLFYKTLKEKIKIFKSELKEMKKVKQKQKVKDEIIPSRSQRGKAQGAHPAHGSCPAPFCGA